MITVYFHIQYKTIIDTNICICQGEIKKGQMCPPLPKYNISILINSVMPPVAGCVFYTSVPVGIFPGFLDFSILPIFK